MNPSRASSQTESAEWLVAYDSGAATYALTNTSAEWRRSPMAIPQLQAACQALGWPTRLTAKGQLLAVSVQKPTPGSETYDEDLDRWTHVVEQAATALARHLVGRLR